MAGPAGRGRRISSSSSTPRRPRSTPAPRARPGWRPPASPRWPRPTPGRRAGRHYIRRGGTLVAWAVPDRDTAATTPFRIVGAHTDSPNLRIKPRPDTGRAGSRQLGGRGVRRRAAQLVARPGPRAVRPGRGPRRGRGDRGPSGQGRPPAAVRSPARHPPRPRDHRATGSSSTPRSTSTRSGVSARPTRAGSPASWPRSWALTTPPIARRGTSWPTTSRRPPCSGSTTSCWPHPGSTTCARRSPPSTLIAWPAGCGRRARSRSSALFDHEEVGSTTAQGRRSPVLAAVLERLVLALGGDARRPPPGPRRLDLRCRPTWPTPPTPTTPSATTRPTGSTLNGGPVIKTNVNQRYATDGGHRGRVHRPPATGPACPSSTTSTATTCPAARPSGRSPPPRLGVAVVDVGVAELAMHSARELMGAADCRLADRGVDRLPVAACLSRPSWPSLTSGSR